VRETVKHLSWILTVPLMIVAVVFAITNRAGATLNLWPLGITVEAPLFILVLGSVFVGLLVGGTIAWMSAGTARRRAREARHRAEAAEREVMRLRNALESNRPPLPGQSRIPAAGS
jgi:uncharacterized integral membrane protein